MTLPPPRNGSPQQYEAPDSDVRRGFHTGEMGNRQSRLSGQLGLGVDEFELLVGLGDKHAAVLTEFYVCVEFVGQGCEEVQAGVPYPTHAYSSTILTSPAPQASDIAIHAREVVALRATMNEVLATPTSQDLERIAADTDRDHWMSASEALDYGIVDELLPLKALAIT